MINYYLRPDGTQVKVDGDNQTITNVVNKTDQKILGHFTSTDYYNRVSEDAINLNWPISNETDFNTAKVFVLDYLTNNA